MLMLYLLYLCTIFYNNNNSSSNNVFTLLLVLQLHITLVSRRLEQLAYIKSSYLLTYLLIYMFRTGAAFAVIRDSGGRTNGPVWTQWPWMLEYSGLSYNT